MELTTSILEWQLEKIKQDKKVIRTARYLYRDLFQLAKKKGYCFSSNRFLAEKHGVAKETVSRWVSSLKKQGYIDTEEIRNKYNEVVERRIYIIIPKDLPISKEKNQKNNENTESRTQMSKAIQSTQEEVVETAPTFSLSTIISDTFKLINQSISTNEKYILSIFEKLYGKDFVLFAIKKSCHANNKLAYIRTLLSDWKVRNVQSVSELIKTIPIKPKSAKYPRKVIRKEIVPDWLNNPTSESERQLTDDDLAKIERIKQIQKQLLNPVLTDTCYI